MTVEILAVQGIAEIRAGDDLVSVIAGAAPSLRDGDVLVVTSKIVSKAAGRVVALDREAAIDAETVRVVARRGSTRIVATRHGFVMAAAGVDASNVEPGHVVLLPVDPDASARALRAGLRARLGVDVGVIVSDTFGRPWRVGVTDAAVGVAGLAALDDLRGRVDAYGNALEVTVTCIADEIAAAADLVKGKLSGVPVAVVRGLDVVGTSTVDAGIAPVVRPAADDMFSLGSRDVLWARVDATRFAPGEVSRAVLDRALATARAAAAPGGFLDVEFLVVERSEVEEVARTFGVELPAGTALALVPWTRGEPGVPELLGVGAAVENALVALTIERLGSRWLWPLRSDAVGELAERGWVPSDAWCAGVIALGPMS